MYLVEKKFFRKMHWEVTLFCNYFHNLALMLPIMLPGLCRTKGTLHPKKVIHMVLIAFCRKVRVQCKEKLFQTPACKPGFHVKISSKKAATDVAEAINWLGTGFFQSVHSQSTTIHFCLINTGFMYCSQGFPHKISSQKESAVLTATANTFLLLLFSFFKSHTCLILFPFHSWNQRFDI